MKKLFKKISYPLYLLLVVWGLLELVGPLIVPAIKGDNFRKKVLCQSLTKPSFDEGLGTNKQADLPIFQHHMGHPYLGYVYQSKGNHINDWGFKGPQPILRKSPDQVNICITGGSVALQVYSHRTSLIKKLKSNPAYKNKEFKIVNMAVGGYKQPQQLLALTYSIFLGAEYDIVINLDGFNEIAVPYATKQNTQRFPFFPRNWERSAAHNRDPQLYKKWGRLVSLTEQKEALATFYTQSVWRYSYVSLLIGHFKLKNLHTHMARVNGEISSHLEANKENRAAMGPSYDFGDETAFFQDLVEKWAHASRQMQALCQTNNIRYFHFLQPNQYIQGSKVLTEEENRIANIDTYPQKRIATYHYSQAVKKAYTYLIEAGKTLEKEVHFKDLTMIFQEEQESVYTDFCCHFNPYGVSELNREIAAYINAVF